MNQPTVRKPPTPPEARLTPYERSVIAKLDAVCRGIDGLGRGLKWVIIFLALLCVSSFGGATYLIRR